MSRVLRVRWLKRDLIIRLMLPMLAIVAMTAALGTYTAQRMTERVFDRWLLDAARSVASVVTFERGEALLQLPPAAEKVLLFDDTDQTFFSVIQGSRLLAGQAGIPTSGSRDLTYGQGRAYLAQFHGMTVRVASVTVSDDKDPGASTVRIMVAETMTKRQRSERELVAVFWPMAGLIAAAAVFIVLAVRRTVRPLEVIAARWNELSNASLQAIGDEDIPRELAPFTSALNRLLARIREMLDRERHFAVTVAHQLRTPLGGLQLGLARAAAAGDVETSRLVIEELSGATQRMARLVQQLLTLGRIDPEMRSGLDFRPCDLVELARDVGLVHTESALRSGIDLEFIAPPQPVMVNVIAELIAEALSNLLDNAITYTPAGGRVVLEVQRDPPQVRVSDSGCGIADEDRPSLFERFVRGRLAKGEGSGLGLPIAQEIALLHGATLSLGVSTWRGTAATLMFGRRSPCPED